MKYLFVLLTLVALTSQAEPLYLPLSKASIDSLQATLRRSPYDTNRVKLLVRLSIDLLARKQVTAASIDSADAYAQQAQALSKQLRFTAGQLASSYSMGWALCERKKLAEGQQLIRAALARSHQLHLLGQEALGWYHLGVTLDKSSENLPARLHHFAQAARYFELAHDQARQAYCLKEVANMHLNQGKAQLARNELLRVEALNHASGSRRLQYTFDLLAVANTALGNSHDALKYGLAAVQQAKATRDTADLRTFYSRLYNIYYELHELQKVDMYVRLALRSAEAYRDSSEAQTLSILLARNLVVLGRPKQAVEQILRARQLFTPRAAQESMLLTTGLLRCYLADKQYQVAAQYCEQLSRQAQAQPNTSVRLQAYLGMSRFYVATQQYAKARIYLPKVIEFSRQQNYKSLTENGYLLLFKVDSAQAQLAAAIRDYQAYVTLHDSIFNEQNSKQIAGLQIQYDTEKREQSIALLTKQTQMQQARIQQREFQRNVFLGGALLLLLLLGLGYNRYRLKQRSNQLLETKQAEINHKNAALEQVVSEKDQLLRENQTLLAEKDWMLKEIHHRVKNNLQVVSSLLATQSRHLPDPQAVAAIRESQNRVEVMALLHQKLYQSDSIARVNMADYGREIITYLIQSFNRLPSVQTKLDLAPVELETTLATPLGLIINEAVTNVLKHAFPPPRRGTLTVSLVSLAPKHYQLTIADDGLGLPPAFDLKKSRSLGMIIMKGLSRQIDGQLALSVTDGVQLILEFETTKKPTYADVL